MKELPIYNDTNKLIVDDEDFERLSKFIWYNSKGVINRKIKKPRGNSRFWHTQNISIANEALETEGFIYDHIDRNIYNNQKINLRECTPTQNSQNRSKSKNCSSQYKGVSKVKRNVIPTWYAQIRVNKKSLRLGTFTDEIEAAKTYDEAALKYFGEFACVNFPVNKEMC